MTGNVWAALAGVAILIVSALLNHVIWLWELIRYIGRSNYTRRL